MLTTLWLPSGILLRICKIRWKGNLNEIYEITYAALTKTSEEGSGVAFHVVPWLGVCTYIQLPLEDPPEETPAKRLSRTQHIADAACCTCVECMQRAA